MCGFAGFLSYRPTGDGPRRRQLLEVMGDAIAHRGPDDARYHDDGEIALVFRRLSIIDVEGGAQPLASENGDLLIVANGEIYNHEALRSELRARHAFASASDCEVPLHAWEEWGEQSLSRLNGMFAMALWDRRARELVLARDRLGIKPLYYCELPHGLLFASELKALLAHPECPRLLDWQALDRPALCQPMDTSYVQGVRMLPPGNMLRVDAGGRIRLTRWWDINRHLGAAPYGTNAQAYVDAYAELLEQVTREHLQRDVGAGMMLSGGLDSALMAAIVARVEPGFPCFTIVERASVLGGDVDAAHRLTARLGLPWHPVRFDHRSLARDMRFGLERFEEAVWMMDSPRFELEWLFKGELHRIARTAHPQLKVMLLGQGADEFAGGYSQRQDQPFVSWREYLREEVEPNLAQEEALATGGMDLLRYLAPASAPAGEGAYHRMMKLMLRQLAHHNLWHEDRSSSWFSLEARVPYLDHRLVELLAGVPAALHERLFWRKEIVRAAWRRFAQGLPLRQLKLGFLDGPDTSSCDRVLRDMAAATYPQFRERYAGMASFRFDIRRLDEAAARLREAAVPPRDEVRRVVECMAATVFQAQCEQGVPVPRRTPGPVLPQIAECEWSALQQAFAQAPGCGVPWTPDDVVQARAGLQVLAPLRGEAYVFMSGGVSLGQLQDPSPWLREFLRHLGTPAAAEFTLQDWIDELEVQPRDFIALVDMLAYRGVIAPPGLRKPADTASAALAV